MQRRWPAGLGLLLLLTGCAGSTTAYPSPDGGFSAEITRDTHTPDVVWRVAVRVGVDGSLGSWSIGCLDGDGPATTPRDVVWTGPATFVLTTRGDEVVTVRLQASGRPSGIEQPVRVLRDC